MLLYLLLGFVALVVLLIVIAALRPDTYRVERAMRINAPAAEIFRHVNELRRWEAWSPWEKVDPALRRSYSGPLSGVGAVYAWEGNNKVGVGRMTVLESKSPELIRLRLEFLKPMAGVATAEFTFRPEPTGTVVTWSMGGELKLVSKLFDLVCSMDKMIGGQFEHGLASLKELTERAPA